jgi:hypothetical protein
MHIGCYQYSKDVAIRTSAGRHLCSVVSYSLYCVSVVVPHADSSPEVVHADSLPEYQFASLLCASVFPLKHYIYLGHHFYFYFTMFLREIELIP